MAKQEPSGKGQYALNLLLAALVSQVGCVTVVVILAALLLGLWLDAHLGTRPWATIVALAASMPVTLVLMLTIVRRLTARIQPMPSIFSSQEAKGDDAREHDA